MRNIKHCVMTMALGALLGVAGPVGAQYYDQSGNCGSAEWMASTTAAGAIQFNGDVDVFEIAVGTGRLTVYTTGSTDTFGTLQSGSYGCPAIVSNDDYPPTTNFRIERDVTAGRYFIAVRHYSSYGRGSYNLVYSFAPSRPPPARVDLDGDQCHTATLLAAGGSLTRSIDVAGDADMFRVNVPPCFGFNCLFTPNIQFFTTGSTDTYGTLYDASCRPILTDDDSGVDLNFLMTVTQRGTYYVKVRHYSPTGMGSYTVTNRVLVPY